jgi:preprotein translocase subunit SecG
MIALLAAGGIGTTILSIFFIIICILLVFMVVITPSQEGGMAAAFGGMGSDSFFGTRANQAINKFTVFLAVSFMVLALWINFANVGQAGSGKSGIEEKFKSLPPAPIQPTPGAPVPGK